MNIGSICDKAVVSAAPGDTVRQALQLMKDRHVGAVVVAEGERPVGIITDRDIALRALVDGKALEAVRLGDIMTPEPVTVREDESVHAAIRLMRKHAVRRLPILNPAGNLVGIAALDDLVLLLGRELYDLAAAVAGELLGAKEK